MQTTQNARMHVNDALNKHHIKLLNDKRLRVGHQRHLGRIRTRRTIVPKYKARVLSLYNLKDPEKQPADDFERDAARPVRPGGPEE